MFGLPKEDEVKIVFEEGTIWQQQEGGLEGESQELATFYQVPAMCQALG